MNDRSNAKPMLIGGEWIAEGEEAIVSVNPANGQVNYEICAATPRHVDAAVESARQAVSAPAWRDMLAHKRARLLASWPTSSRRVLKICSHADAGERQGPRGVPNTSGSSGGDIPLLRGSVAKRKDQR
jgi:hypothetical protein